MRIKFCYGGESHGYGLVGMLDSLPQGLKIDQDMIGENLSRRRKRPGRSGRKNIENDNFNIACGLLDGITTGGPLGFVIENRSRKLRHQEVPRPGHVDLAGALKYELNDLDPAAERSSARETALRVVAGSLCIQLLKHFEITIVGWAEAIGKISGNFDINDLDMIKKLVRKSQVGFPDPQVSKLMINEIKKASEKDETLGGIVRVAVSGVIPGIGGISHPEKRLDSRLASALMSIPSVKAVEIGEAFQQAKLYGSKAHDPVFWDGEEFYRKSNLAGGIEGGISNGEMILTRLALKPIPTLKEGLPSVNIKSKKAMPGPVYRSDVCAVPSAVVVAESMTAIVLADAYMEKFGGDSLKETIGNFENYKDAIKSL